MDLCVMFFVYHFQMLKQKVYLLLESLIQQNDFSDCNWTRTHNHLVHKRTLNHLAKLDKWLSCVVSTYLYLSFF